MWRRHPHFFLAGFLAYQALSHKKRGDFGIVKEFFTNTRKIVSFSVPLPLNLFCLDAAAYHQQIGAAIASPMGICSYLSSRSHFARVLAKKVNITSLSCNACNSTGHREHTKPLAGTTLTRNNLFQFEITIRLIVASCHCHAMH